MKKIVNVLVIVIVLLMISAGIYLVRKNKEVKVVNITPQVKLLEDPDTIVLDDLINKNYRSTKVIKNKNIYFKFKKEIEYKKSYATGTELDILRYAELKMDDKYSLDEHIKNSPIFLDSEASKEMKADILYFLLHNFLETGLINPSIYAISNSKIFSTYLLELEKLSPEYKSGKDKLEFLSHQDKIKIYLELNNIIRKDYPSIGISGTLADMYLGLYTESKDVKYLEKSKENINAVIALIDAPKSITVNDYVVGLNHTAAALIIYKNMGIDFGKSPEELSKNAVYYSNKYKTNYTNMSVFVLSYVLSHKKDPSISELELSNQILIKNKNFLNTVLKTSNIRNGTLDINDNRIFSLNTLRLMSLDKNFENYLASTGFDISKLK